MEKIIITIKIKINIKNFKKIINNNKNYNNKEIKKLKMKKKF